MAQYGKTNYWDERYTKDPEPFDWYQRYSGVRDLINQYIKREDAILMSGCGNSRLTEDMFEDGYTSITNVDVSRVVIDQMLERYKDKPTLQWQQMNVCSLDFPDETFDVVVDKGTLDSILCGEGSTANVAKMCGEISRVLKPTGVFFIVSYGVPDNRLNYLEKEDIYSWNVTVHTVPKPTVSAAAVPSSEDASGVHYIYICTKGGSAEEGAEFTRVYDDNDLEGRPFLYPLESEYDRFNVGRSLCKNVGGMGVYAGVRGMLTDGCCAALYYNAGFLSERWMRREQRQPIFRYVETGGYQGLSAHVVATSLQSTIGLSSALIYSHDLFDEYIPDKEVSIIENSGFWENYMDGSESRLQKFYSNVQRNNFEKIIIPISGPSTRTLKIHPSNSVQMVFIDGDHTYQGALFDLYEGWRILEPGGIMLVHDCLPTSTEPRDPNSKLEVLEVREAVRDFSESHNVSWNLMIGTMYIAVLGKPLS